MYPRTNRQALFVMIALLSMAALPVFGAKPDGNATSAATAAPSSWGRTTAARGYQGLAQRAPGIPRVDKFYLEAAGSRL